MDNEQYTKAKFNSEKCKNLSDLLRAKLNTYSPTQRIFIEGCFLATLGFNSLRYVQLTTRYGKTQRNFLHLKLDEYTFFNRCKIASSILEAFPPNLPTSTYLFTDLRNNLQENIRKFLDYFSNDFTLFAMTRLMPDGFNDYIWEYQKEDSNVVPEFFTDEDIDDLPELPFDDV